MRRYQLRKGDVAVEAPFTEDGKRALERLRKAYPAVYRYGRIRDILQLRPDLVQVGIAYAVTRRPIGGA